MKTDGVLMFTSTLHFGVDVGAHRGLAERGRDAGLLVFEVDLRGVRDQGALLAYLAEKFQYQPIAASLDVAFDVLSEPDWFDHETGYMVLARGVEDGSEAAVLFASMLPSMLVPMRRVGDAPYIVAVDGRGPGVVAAALEENAVRYGFPDRVADAVRIRVHPAGGMAAEGVDPRWAALSAKEREWLRWQAVPLEGGDGGLLDESLVAHFGVGPGLRQRLAAVARERGITVVEVDASAVTDAGSLGERLANSIVESGAKPGDGRPGGPDVVVFVTGAEESADGEAGIGSLLPVAVADWRKRGVGVAIVVDSRGTRLVADAAQSNQELIAAGDDGVMLVVYPDVLQPENADCVADTITMLDEARQANW